MAKISIKKDALLKALNALAKCIPSKETMGADSLFKFEIRKDSGHIYVINSRVKVKSFISLESSEEISFCVHHKIMKEMVRTFPDGDVTIKTNGDPVKSIVLKPEGQKKTYTIACDKADDFPIMPETFDGEKFSFPSGTLVQMLAKLSSYCDSKNIIPSFANIVMYPVGGKLYFVSGNDFLIYTIKTDHDIKESYLIPDRISDYVSFLSGPEQCEIILSKSMMKITHGGTEMYVSLSEGKASNYKMLMDNEPSDDLVMFDKKQLSESVTRLSILSDDTQIITFEAENNNCTLSTVNADFGNEGIEVIEIGDAKPLNFHIKHSIIFKLCQDSDGDHIGFNRKDHMGFARTSKNSNELWMMGLSNR